MINPAIGNLIRNKRVEMNLTQTDVATLLGHDAPQFISLVERGLSKAPINMLGKLSVILKLNRKFIIDLLVSDYSAHVNSEFNKGALL